MKKQFIFSNFLFFRDFRNTAEQAGHTGAEGGRGGDLLFSNYRKVEEESVSPEW